MANIEEKMTRLEGQVRWLKILLLVVTTLAGLALFLSSGTARWGPLAGGVLLLATLHGKNENQEVKECIRTRELQIVDQDGENRLGLYAEAGEGGPSLFCWDDEGRCRAELGQRGDRGVVALSLVDENGTPRLQLTGGKGASGLVLANENQDIITQLSECKTGSHLVFYDDEGKTRICLEQGWKGPVFGLGDENGIYRLYICHTSDLDPIVMCDSSGNPTRTFSSHDNLGL